MPTNDERREVAARLRDYVDLDFEDANPYWYVMKSAYGDVSIHGDNELFSRLADLIEPEPKRTTRLELVATEVDKNGDALAVGVHCALCGLLDEEVVGADPDNWMLWRYCPSCGAEVVS